ncbi:hypothetical protein [Rubrobacter xylanophilus]|nr:hypothetical protein [Rubrobacter xylanophilus]
MSVTHLDARTGMGRGLLAGLVTGIVAGVVFAMFEMVVAAVMGQGFFAPLRMIAAIGLGEGALPPQASVGLATIVPVGLVIHMVLSMLYGAGFGMVASVVGILKENRWALVGAATLFGLALWIVNFYVIAPFAFPWFGMANPLVQFIAHTFFFGTVLGLLLAPRSADER